MRILPVTEKWPKLKNPSWTTFRLQRRDKDWQVGEVVQVVLHHRSKQREVLGVARIIGKEPRRLLGRLAYKGDKDTRLQRVRGVKFVSAKEAHEDGFKALFLMRYWFYKTHGGRIYEPLNKLTVEWIGEHHV